MTKTKQMLEWVATSAKQLIDEHDTEQSRAIISFMLQAPSKFQTKWELSNEQLIEIAQGGIQQVITAALDIPVQLPDVDKQTPCTFNSTSKTVQLIKVTKANTIKPIKRRVGGYVKTKVDRLTTEQWIEQMRENIIATGYKESNKRASVSTGYKGVIKVGNTYKAQITIKKQVRHLGSFDNPTDASNRYQEVRTLLGI